MELGISIMIKTPQDEIPGAFSFVKPMQGAVWSVAGLAIFSVAVVLLLATRTPSNAQVFTLRNTLWFSIASIFRQGTIINPRYSKFQNSRDSAPDIACSTSLVSRKDKMRQFRKGEMRAAGVRGKEVSEQIRHPAAVMSLGKTRHYNFREQ